MYTQVALLVEIPPASERGQLPEKKDGGPAHGSQDADADAIKN